MKEDFLIDLYKEIHPEEKNLILVIYDIVDNKRRTKFFKYLSGYLNPVQRSCFESFLTDKEFNKLALSIDDFIDENEDNVRIYKLSAHGKVYNFGLDIDIETDGIIII